MSQKIGPREQQLREIRERNFVGSTTKRSVGTKEILADALRQQAAAVPAKKPPKKKKKGGR